MNEPAVDLKTLVRRLERRHRNKQVATGLVAGVCTLGAIALIAPIASTVFEEAKPQPAAISAAPALPAEPDLRAFADVSVEGSAAIVLDLATGQTLYEKNARSQLPLASLTKLLTVFAAQDVLAPESVVTITDTALLPEGDSGFLPGERFAFADLAAFALVTSSNDATAAIAEAAAAARGTTGKALLADAASRAGLEQTYALNGTGLDESASVSGGYGSARDVAVLSGALLRAAPDLARASTRTSSSIVSLDGISHTLPNTNPDAYSFANILLSKTGFTDLAGGNLSVVYDAGVAHPVAIVVLGSSRDGRFADVERLRASADRHFASTATR